MGNFKELRVWHEALNLAEDIYRLTSDEPFSKDFGLRNQIQKAVVSIASNISEGDERGSIMESVYFLNVAKASAAEVLTQLIIAYRIGYVDDESFIGLEDDIEKIRAGLINLIGSRKKYRNRSRKSPSR